MTQNQKRTNIYREANLECARMIAADPVKYSPDSLMGIWAAMVLERAETPADSEAGPLFSEAA